MPATEVEDNTLYIRLYGGLYGVLVSILLTIIGIGVLESRLYGVIAGLLGGVGAFLFLPWLLCMNAAETAGEDASYHEMLNQWGIDFRLGVFGAGLKLGGILILLTGVNTLPVLDPALGLWVGAAVVVGSALLAGISGWHFQRSRRDRFDRDHSPEYGSQDQQGRSRDHLIVDREGDSETIQVSFETLLRPNTLGEAFGALFAVSVGFLYLSVIGFMSYLLLVPEASATVGIAAITVSWLGITVSLFGYSVWSVQQLRRLPQDDDQPTFRTPTKLLVHVIALLIADSDDLNAYDRRLRRTAVTFVLAVIALSAPWLAQIGSPGRFPGS